MCPSFKIKKKKIICWIFVQLSCWLICRWARMWLIPMTTWDRSSWWNSRRRSSWCVMTGSAGTSQWRPLLDSVWNFPVSAGWWMTRRWCYEMAEVELRVDVLFLTGIPTRGLTLSRFCCSYPASRRQERPVEGTQAKGAGAQEGNLQAGSFCSLCSHVTPWFNTCSIYRWLQWKPGFGMSIDAGRYKDLPQDILFDSQKEVDFVVNYAKA